MLTSPGSNYASVCAHCGSPIPSYMNSRFCCSGCQAVFSILQERGLAEYYKIRAKDRTTQAPVPVTRAEGGFAYLDDPEFLRLYSIASPNGLAMRFFLEGVHCAACVWLTEKIGQFVDGVDFARLDLGNSVISVHLTPSGSFAAVAEELNRLGYRPHPIRVEELGKLQKRADHVLLAQTGVAGACAGNIMLLTTSLYAGASGSFGEFFRWACFVLSLPVLAYSALPFYQNAYNAIRAKEVSIDIPIAVGILIGAVSSIFNLLTGSKFLYFDSLSMLVFLMLASRYLLRKTQQSAINSSKLIHFLTPSTAWVKRVGEADFKESPADQIQVGDQIEVRPGDCLPVDGVVLQGNSSLNNALLTGESRMVGVQPGSPVFAGTVNGDELLVIEALASGSASRLGKILKAVETDLSKKARVTTFADRMAKGFVTAVLGAIVVVFLVGLRSGIHEAVNLALALSIVTCPCAFALATPLALSLSLGRCAKQGVLIKGADVLERLSEADSVVFDKTGTLTYGNYEVLSCVVDSNQISDLDFSSLVVSLEARSRHPVARAIVDFFSVRVPGSLPLVAEYKETPGRGVSGVIRGRLYEVKASKDAGGEVRVTRDGQAVARIRLGDKLRTESPQVIARLKRMGLGVSLISGDSSLAVEKAARNLGLTGAWKAELSPEDKRAEIVKQPRAIMVGDGANDANALAASFVGVAVHGGMEVSLQSADVYCRKPGVGAIAPLVVVARETMKVIHRNFAFSLVYNGIGITGVILGKVSPLFAAVLMPISACTVFLSSIAGTSALRRALKEMGR